LRNLVVVDDEPFGHEPVEDAEPDPLLPTFLVAVDDAPAAPIVPVSPVGVPQRYRRSLGASVVAAGLLGIRDVIEEPKDDRPVVEQYADEGDVDRPIDLVLDPDDPSASVVRIRPDR